MRKVKIIPGILLTAPPAILLIGGWVGSSQVIGSRPEWQKQIAQPSDYRLQASTVEFSSRDGVPLKAWWLAARGAARATVVLAHGRDGNRSHMLSRAAFLAPSGYNCLALDLRAHGESGGRFVTPGYLEAQDVLGAVDYLRRQGRGEPIVLLGHSSGAVAVLRAAAQSPDLAAVVADSPFLSVYAMMARARELILNDPRSSLGAKLGMWFAAAPLLDVSTRLVYRLRTGFDFDESKADVLPVISGLERPPILFIAGERDPIAPAEDTRRMFHAARHPQNALVVLPNAGHNTFRAAPQEYEAAVLRFLDQVMGSSRR